MLIPITREKFEQLIPLTGTAAQYRYYAGSWPDFLRKLLISFLGVVVIWLLGEITNSGGATVSLFAFIAGLYWLWSPVYWATRRNSSYRRFPYAGFWRGNVLEAFVSEELLGTEETVNEYGELVIVENRERRINLQVGDKNGFEIQIQAPLLRLHRNIKPGQVVELLALSKDPDLERISKVTDAYIPQLDIWVSNYPVLRRDIFVEVSEELSGRRRKRTKASSSRRYSRL
ncbi:phosphate ABC transporter permease [Euhalothece natronophila Z-M001]|uniref:Phosphate ABC transporter permease n=1 Tax=Euhalothece natronophila Z-M001 TaxID=522448 RepID=A0A5B8NL37_9CHRO|nr:phosphate ABC transporter permease [Euhalothece natronophila]QDZ39744.1 phosphate ABC transporter permease [Euhalothece natronophila Z-M001]